VTCDRARANACASSLPIAPAARARAAGCRDRRQARFAGTRVAARSGRWARIGSELGRRSHGSVRRSPSRDAAADHAREDPEIFELVKRRFEQEA